MTAASTEDVLAQLSQPTCTHVHSTSSLTEKTDKAAAAIDRERARKGTGGDEESHRKPELRPLRGDARADLNTTTWQTLGTLARALTLARQGLGRGLAEHWQSLKYCQALARGSDGYLALTEKGQIPEQSYRAMQARELGRAFGLCVAERAVRSRFPDHLISTVDAEVVLLAGFARSGSRPTLGSRPQPDYFIEAWRPGEPSTVFQVTVNGNHQVAGSRTGTAGRTAFRQLARGSERVEHTHIGAWNATPCLLLSTELLTSSGVTVNALEAPGHEQPPVRPAQGRGNVDTPVPEQNLPYVDTVRVPCGDDAAQERRHNAFFVPVRKLGWFDRVLARAGAASQLSFAGAGREIATYLTAKQGRKHYEQHTFAGSSSVRDAEHAFGPGHFVGTDQVFRLGGKRVEAFSGMAKELYELLARGEVEQYRRQAYARRKDWPCWDTAHGWGPVSFRDDGTVMALRILPGGERPVATVR